MFVTERNSCSSKYSTKYTTKMGRRYSDRPNSKSSNETRGLRDGKNDVFRFGSLSSYQRAPVRNRSSFASNATNFVQSRSRKTYPTSTYVRDTRVLSRQSPPSTTIITLSPLSRKRFRVQRHSERSGRRFAVSNPSGSYSDNASYRPRVIVNNIRTCTGIIHVNQHNRRREH